MYYFYRSLLIFVIFCFGFIASSSNVTAQSNPSPKELYQANPQIYNLVVNGRNYSNNKNPFGIENYACVVNGSVGVNTQAFRDDCVPTAVTKNGTKWWSGACAGNQPGHDSPTQDADIRRMNGTGSDNSQIPICTEVVGERSQYNFIETTTQFTYYSGMCANGSVVALAPRPDIANPVCSNLSFDTMMNNPSNYSPNQRACFMEVDDAADIVACKGGRCNTFTYSHDQGIIWSANQIVSTPYRNICSLFSQGDGVYDVSLRAYDTGRGVYGSSSFYLTWLYNSISGSVFVDTNKNGVRDVGESNYSGPVSLTIDGRSITIPSGGNYTFSGLIPESTHTISYNSLPINYFMTSPLNGPPPTHVVTVGAGCDTNGAPAAQCAGDISNLNFAISNSMPWMQGYDLDMRLDNGYTSIIPQTPDYPAYASVTSSISNTPGIIYSGDSTANFGQGQASVSNWWVGGTVYPEVYQATSSQLATSYQHLLEIALSADINPVDLASIPTCRNLANCTLPASLPNGIYQANGNVTLNNYTPSADKDHIFLINGNLTLNTPITVPSTSVAFFAAARDIIVPSVIGATTNTFPLPTAQLQGFYSAGEDFIIQGINNCLTGTDKMLGMAGAIVVNANGTGGNLINQRDLCGDNPKYPAFSIEARPDFILHAPTFLMKQNTIYREDAP